MTTMLERAARAAGSVVIGADERGGPVFPDHHTAMDLARAVLMAVREPEIRFVYVGDALVGRSDMIFTAMIDAILNESSAE